MHFFYLGEWEKVVEGGPLNFRNFPRLLLLTIFYQIRYDLGVDTNSRCACNGGYMFLASKLVIRFGK
jgi:hypothetical protein